MAYYDFFIPEECRGRKITLPEGEPDWPDEPVDLLIPSEAHYLDVNPLEDEDEYQGCQDQSPKQQLKYYNKNSEFVSAQDLENQIITWRLMNRLERLLSKQY